MRQTWLGLWVIMTLLYGGPLFAQKNDEMNRTQNKVWEGPAATTERGAVIAFEGVSNDVVSAALKIGAARIHPSAAAKARQFDAGTTDLIDSLRQAMVPRRAEMNSQAVCEEEGATFAQLLELTVEAIDFLELDRAGRLLSRLQTVFSCGTQVIPQDELGHFLFLSAVYRQLLNTTYLEQLTDALAIFPRAPFPNDYSHSVQRAFREARKKAAHRHRVTVRVDIDDLAGLRLLVDGEAQATSRVLNLPVGPHFLQLVGPDGRGVAGDRLMLVENEETPPIWPPHELRPPQLDLSLKEMEDSVFTGRLELENLAALVTLMRYERYDWIMMVAVAPETQQIGVLTIFRNSEMERHTLPPLGLEAGGPSVQSEEARSRLPASAWIAVGLGGAGVVFGGLYGYEYHRLRNELFPDQDAAEQAARGAEIGRAGMIVSMTGALLSAGWTLFGAGPHHHKGEASSPSGAHLRLALFPKGGVFCVEGTW